MSDGNGDPAEALPDRLRIERVETAGQWKAFYQLRVNIYRDDPVAAIPLKSMERAKLDVNSSFFAHAERVAWIALEGDRCVGRIVAIVDRLHNEYHNDTLGFFGFFECTDDADAAKGLVEVAGQWLREKGCTSMRGPMSPSMKGEMGVLIDGFEYPPRIMMGHSRRWYDKLLLGCDLDVVKTFYAFRFESDDPKQTEQYEKLNAFEAKVLKRYPDLRFEQISRENFAEAVQEVNVLGNEVRKEGWGFVPSTKAEVDTMIKNLGPIIRHEAFQVAYYKDELVGFVIAIPDVNWAFRKTFGKWDWLRKIQLLFWLKRIPTSRVIALGAAKKFRSKGIGMLLIRRLSGQRELFKEWEMSWVLEDNLKSLGALSRGVAMDKYKTYRLYEKTLGPVNTPNS